MDPYFDECIFSDLSEMYVALLETVWFTITHIFVSCSFLIIFALVSSLKYLV